MNQTPEQMQADFERFFGGAAGAKPKPMKMQVGCLKFLRTPIDEYVRQINERLDLGWKPMEEFSKTINFHFNDDCTDFTANGVVMFVYFEEA